MTNLNIDNVMIFFDGKLIDQCLLQIEKTTTSKIVLFIKNGIEILKFDLDSEIYLEKTETHRSLLVKAKHQQYPIFFSCLEDLLKCFDWFENKRLNEKKQPEEKLVIQLIIDSFEKTLTLEYKKLNLKPEDYIFEKIVDCWNNLTQVYGFFTTVCQSSGFGKSRACQNLSKKAYVVYCCLRSSLSRSGYPKRSYLAKDLTDFFTSEQSARKYFISYFNMFFHYLNKNPLISHEEFFKKFSNGFDGQSTFSEHYELIVNNIKQLQSNCPKTDQLIDYVNNKPLVFVFDEASSLLKPDSDPKSDELFIKPNYFVLRSLISEMNRDKKIFVLFLDTFSSLSSFMPNKWFDPSKRASQSILIEPIYLLPNWDVYVDIEAIKTPKDSMIFENICSFGRPLWGSLLKAKQSDKKYNQIGCKDFVSLAKEKLVGGGIKKLNEFTINDSLAILSCRIGTIRPLLTSTCQDLVAKNMAVCTYANYEKNIFRIEYPSEPFLSNAAATYFNETISTNNMIQSGLFFLINNLNQAVLNSIVDQGDKGETISKILLLKAYDASVNQLELDDTLDLIRKYCSYIKVESFIKNLYGQIGLETIRNQLDLNESNKLLNGYVRFNHFVRAKCSKEKLNLKNLIKRCCAIQCVKTEPGVDFVIPIIYSLDENTFEQMSVILVQTKLHATITPIQMNKLKKIQICRSDIIEPFLVIYMQLGQVLEPLISQEFNSKLKNRAIIYSEGISSQVFCSINADEETSLRNFSKSQNCSYLTGLEEKIAEQIYFSTDNLILD